MTNNICFIPAKGNSRRLKKKNICLVGGRPLVSRAIDSAFKSKCFDKVYVSSNDDEILELASKSGASTLKRKDELCIDGVSAKEVVWHHLNEINQDFDFVGMLMPTTPLRDGDHISKAYQLLLEQKANSLISVCQYDESLKNALKIVDSKIRSYYDEDKQSLFSKNEKINAYHFNGAIYLARYDFFMKKKDFLNEDTIPFIMDRKSSIDVNTLDELEIADALTKI